MKVMATRVLRSVGVWDEGNGYKSVVIGGSTG